MASKLTKRRDDDSEREEHMSGLRTMRRSVKKANGMALRRGPEKGTTGKEKGPARTPSREEMRQAMRSRLKAQKAAELEAEAEKAA